MVHHHRSYFHLPRKGDDSQQQHQLDIVELCGGRKPAKPAGRLFYLLALVVCSLLLILVSSSPRLLIDAFGTEYLLQDGQAPAPGPAVAPCATMGNNSICCDRTSSNRSDVCYMRGDVRTHGGTKSMSIVSPAPLDSADKASSRDESIRPYTRKWEASVMATIDELRLRVSDSRGLAAGDCDVRHDVPAVVFSTGGYTGNVYHEFNDGILPLYITSQRFRGKVMFVILEYHDWWITKYQEIISRLSDYPPVDFTNDRRIHCFPEATVGLRIHDELAIDSNNMDDNKTILDFRRLLDEAYAPRIVHRNQNQSAVAAAAEEETKKPKLVIVSRNGSRAIENEGDLVRLAEGVGFSVEVLRPKPTTELAEIYQALNSSDVMVGVHGAAMTHFLFMRPGSVFIQIVPLGTDWAAEAYYGEPAKKMGLKYWRYRILPAESSLSREYKKDDPVLRDPERLNAEGWQVTKRVYLDGQNVRLDMARFRRHLGRAHQYLVSKRESKGRQES